MDARVAEVQEANPIWILVVFKLTLRYGYQPITWDHWDTVASKRTMS